MARNELVVITKHLTDAQYQITTHFHELKNYSMTLAMPNGFLLLILPLAFGKYQWMKLTKKRLPSLRDMVLTNSNECLLD
jgi:hypothetical protein